MIVLNISREFCWPKGRLPRKTVEMILCLPTLVLAQCTVHKCIIFQKRKRKKCVSLRWESISFISTHFFSLKHFSVLKVVPTGKIYVHTNVLLYILAWFCNVITLVDRYVNEKDYRRKNKAIFIMKEIGTSTALQQPELRKSLDRK